MKTTFEPSPLVREFNALVAYFDSYTAGLVDQWSVRQIYAYLEKHPAEFAGLHETFGRVARQLGYTLPD